MSIRCEPADSNKTRGEKAYSAPARNAANGDRTHRSATHIATTPEMTGAAITATLSEAKGPKVAVTGRSTMLQIPTEVLARRLMP